MAISKFVPVTIKLEIEISGMNTNRDLPEWEMCLEMGVRREIADCFEIGREQVSVVAEIEPEGEGTDG